MKNSENLRAKIFLKHLGLLCAAAVIIPGSLTSASAAAYNWVGASGSTWDSGWTGGFVPTTADDLTILGPLNAAGTLTIDVANTSAAKTINFTDPFAVTLGNFTSGSDKTLTVQSGLTTGTGAVTIGSATAGQGVLVALGAAQTWSIGSGGLTLNNSYSGTFTLTKTGTGTLTLNAANASSGTLAINGGTVVANGNTAAVLVSGKAINLGGGTLNYTSSNGAANTQTLGSIGSTAGANTIKSEVTGGGGTSTLTVGSITRTAGSTLNLVTSGAGATINYSTAAGSLSGGIFYNGDYAAITSSGVLSAITYGTTYGTNPTANISGTIGTIVNTNEFYNLTGNSSLNGQSLNNGGTIRIGGNFTLTQIGTTSVTGLLTNGATAAVISGGGVLRSGSEMTIATNGAGDVLTINNGFIPFNNSSSNGITKAGTGKLVLTANNTYHGTTLVTQGTLQSTSATGLGFGGTETAINLGITNSTAVAAGATLDLAPASAMTVNEVISLNGGGLTNSNSGTTTTIDNGIAAVNLTNLGTGTATTAGSSFSIGGAGSGAAGTMALTTGAISSFALTTSGSGYTGSTPINIVFTTPGSTGAAGTAIISSVAVSGTGNTVGGAGNLVVNAVVANGSSSGGFTKIGAGNLTLSGANTYTGGTVVSAGVLIASNAAALGTGSVNVNGGSLQSTVTDVGTGALTFSSGSIAANGSSTGTFTLAGNTNFAMSGGTLGLTFASTSSFDQILGSGTGTFSLTGGTLDLGGLVAGGYGSTYQLFSGFTSGSVAGISITNYDTANFLASVSNAGVLSFTAVPEPSTYALLGSGLASLWFLRRRKKVSV